MYCRYDPRNRIWATLPLPPSSPELRRRENIDIAIPVPCARTPTYFQCHRVHPPVPESRLLEMQQNAVQDSTHRAECIFNVLATCGRERLGSPLVFRREFGVGHTCRSTSRDTTRGSSTSGGRPAGRDCALGGPGAGFNEVRCEAGNRLGCHAHGSIGIPGSSKPRTCMMICSGPAGLVQGGRRPCLSF